MPVYILSPANHCGLCDVAVASIRTDILLEGREDTFLQVDCPHWICAGAAHLCNLTGVHGKVGAVLLKDPGEFLSFGTAHPSSTDSTEFQNKDARVNHPNLSPGSEGEGGLLIRGTVDHGGCLDSILVGVHPALLVFPVASAAPSHPTHMAPLWEAECGSHQ